MRTVSLIAAMVAAVSAFGLGAVAAADLISTSPALTPDKSLGYAAPAADRWTGSYAGGNAGAGYVTATPTSQDYALGLQAGYNQQFGMLVLGGELEGAFTNGTQFRVGTGGILEQNWGGTAKLRGGLAFDNVLLYGTAGLATAYLDSKGTVTSKDQWVAGLAFGGGVEVAVDETMSVKLEYTQTRFSDVQSTIGGTSRTDDLVGHAIKAGLNFKF
jgi:outer membrane immunogenic protein